MTESENELFEQWWDNEGQYHRAGGSEYCKTFAYHAWEAVINREGHKLVPCEPTKEMLIAADNCVIDGKVTSHNIYKAMIGAAP